MKWVSVDERLPNLYEVVKVKYEGYWPFAPDPLYNYTYLYGEDSWANLDKHIHDAKITHWLDED